MQTKRRVFNFLCFHIFCQPPPDFSLKTRGNKNLLPYELCMQFTVWVHGSHEKANLEKRKPRLCCEVATCCCEVAQCVASRRLSSPSIKADY